MAPAQLVYFTIVFVTAVLFVGVVRRLAIAAGVMDHPTHRGSHHQSTPRGGGLGAIAAILLGFLWAGYATDRVRILAGVVACAVIATVGWLDDRGGLSVRIRLFAHVASGLVVGAVAVGMTPSMNVPTLALGAAWLVWTVSSINLVNFMDGINGLVASQVAIFGASIAAFSCNSPVTFYGLAVAAGCLGFLPWNFPRARIFLGDVGSGALGFLIAVVGLIGVQDHCPNLAAAYLPLAPLFGDAIVTLVRRWRRGEKLTQAHRSHLYQRLANGGAGHTRVTLIFAAASLVGAVVAHAMTPQTSAGLTAVYLIGLMLLGSLLERWATRLTGS